jgi:hypothetical protein
MAKFNVSQLLFYFTFLIPFYMQVGMEMSKRQERQATQECNKAEIREILQLIIQSQDEMRNLLSMPFSHDWCPAEEVMERLQTVGFISFLTDPRSKR